MTSQPCACALTRGTRSAGKSSSSVSYSSASYNSKRAKFGRWATLIALFTPNIYLWGFVCIQVQMQETQFLLFAKNKCTVLSPPPKKKPAILELETSPRNCNTSGYSSLTFPLHCTEQLIYPILSQIAKLPVVPVLCLLHPHRQLCSVCV